MFTGIVEELGVIRHVAQVDQGVKLEVSIGQLIEDVAPGSSVAVNGVCLTVTSIDKGVLAFDVSAETLERTSLRYAEPGMWVNLERPLTLSSRLGGHLVQGHIDGTGSLIEVNSVGEGYLMRFGFPSGLRHYIVEKGSLAVDGISLTVAGLDSDSFRAAIIPHTWRSTNLSKISPGAAVNLEVDIIAKYVERLMQR